MRKRRTKKKEDGFSLFSFMDVMSGVIGILALIICVIAIQCLNDSRLLEMQWTSDALKPVFIDCRKEGLVIHPGKRLVEFDQIWEHGNAWTNQIQSTQMRRDSEYFVFLIRPDGISSFQRSKYWLNNQIHRNEFQPVNGTLNRRGILIGKDFIDANKKLNFEDS